MSVDWIQGSRTTSDDCPYSIRPTGEGNASEDRRRSGSIERPTSGLPARQRQRLPVQPGRRRTGGLQLLVPVQCPGRPVGSTGKSSDTAARLLGPLVGFQRVQGLGGRTTPTTGRNQPNPVGDLDGVLRNLDGVLRNHLSDYVHELQKVVVGNPDWECDQIYKSMRNHPLQKSGVVQLDRFQRGANGHFEATIGVSEKVGSSRRCLEVNSDTTIGNMGEFRGVDQGGTT